MGLFLGLSIGYVAVRASGTSSPPLPTVIEQVRSQVDATHAMGYMRQVWETDRWFTFPKFQETAEMLRRTMKSIGLSDVELLGAQDKLHRAIINQEVFKFDIGEFGRDFVDDPAPKL